MQIKPTQRLYLTPVRTAVIEMTAVNWEGDREVVKNSGRDESIWAVIYLCIEAMLGIFLHIYPYLN
jgi:hypothetical protein